MNDRLRKLLLLGAAAAATFWLGCAGLATSDVHDDVRGRAEKGEVATWE